MIRLHLQGSTYFSICRNKWISGLETWHWTLKKNTSFHSTHSWSARTLFEWCSHSVNILWGANSFNTTTFLLNSWANLLKVIHPRLYGTNWQYLSVPMNPEFFFEFHFRWQSSYRCSYKIVSRRKHAVHHSTNPFQTKGYSQPGHLVASFPFTSHAKNIKTPLSCCPIHWRTLYIWPALGWIETNSVLWSSYGNKRISRRCKINMGWQRFKIRNLFLKVRISVEWLDWA
jgi:hypothetical protein